MDTATWANLVTVEASVMSLVILEIWCFGGMGFQESRKTMNKFIEFIEDFKVEWYFKALKDLCLPYLRKSDLASWDVGNLLFQYAVAK